MELKIEIVKDFPPNYEKIKEILGEAQEGTFYCYGSKIYNPSGIQIPEDLIYHEAIHTNQQGDKADEWWDKYLKDPKFRMEQEIEAYGEQYKWVSNRVKDRNQLAKFLFKISSILSGKMYGNAISYGEAEARIKTFAKGRK